MFCPAFCHVDIDVCIYSTCAFLIVKWMLMLIMYSAVSAIFYFLYFYGGGGGGIALYYYYYLMNRYYAGLLYVSMDTLANIVQSLGCLCYVYHF